MKIYKISRFIDLGQAYIIDGNNKITQVETHTQGIIELYNLEKEIRNNFKRDFGVKLDWGNDWNTVIQYVEDFMMQNEIFNIVVDLKENQVYVRPNRNVKPSSIQMKEISDWAIEHGWKENVIIDFVVAKSNNWYRFSQDYQIYSIQDSIQSREDIVPSLLRKKKKKKKCDTNWYRSNNSINE